MCVSSGLLNAIASLSEFLGQSKLIRNGSQIGETEECVMGRSIIIALFLIASVRMEALSDDCANAGLVLRTSCPTEQITECIYDESQCDILNLNPNSYSISKWEKKQIGMSGYNLWVELSGTGKCAVSHTCSGTFTTTMEYPRFFSPVITKYQLESNSSKQAVGLPKHPLSIRLT